MRVVENVSLYFGVCTFIMCDGESGGLLTFFSTCFSCGSATLSYRCWIVTVFFSWMICCGILCLSEVVICSAELCLGENPNAT